MIKYTFVCVCFRKRAPYIAYLTRCRQGLQTSQAHLERLLQRVLRDKEVANRYFTTVCVRLLLEHMESKMLDFIKGISALSHLVLTACLLWLPHYRDTEIELNVSTLLLEYFQFFQIFDAPAVCPQTQAKQDVIYWSCIVAARVRIKWLSPLQRSRVAQQPMTRQQQWRIFCATCTVPWPVMPFGSMQARTSCRMPRWLSSAVLWTASLNWPSTPIRMEIFSETSE